MALPVPVGSLFERTFTLVLRIANAILEDRVDPNGFAAALSAQGDQVVAELRAAERGFDDAPGGVALSAVLGARASLCGQVAGEQLLETWIRGGPSAVTKALDAFDRSASALARYATASSTGDLADAVAAVEAACTQLPPDLRAALGD